MRKVSNMPENKKKGESNLGERGHYREKITSRTPSSFKKGSCPASSQGLKTGARQHLKQTKLYYRDTEKRECILERSGKISKNCIQIIKEELLGIKAIRNGKFKVGLEISQSKRQR